MSRELRRLKTFVVISCALVAANTMLQRLGVGADRQTVDRIQAPSELIKQLVSPNFEPSFLDHNEKRKDYGEKYKLPAGYDLKAQGRIYAARRELRNRGVDAFPQLIKRLEDKQYSITACDVITEVYYNLSVGDVCRDILSCQVEPFGYWMLGKGDPRARPQRPSYFYTQLHDKDTAERWWAVHKDKSLREIQIEALEWTISREKKEGQKFVADVQYLTEELKKLQQAEKPLKPRYSGFDELGHESNR